MAFGMQPQKIIPMKITRYAVSKIEKCMVDDIYVTIVPSDLKPVPAAWLPIKASTCRYCDNEDGHENMNAIEDR